MVETTAALYDKAVKALQAGQVDTCGNLLAQLKVASGAVAVWGRAPVLLTGPLSSSGRRWRCSR